MMTPVSDRNWVNADRFGGRRKAFLCPRPPRSAMAAPVITPHDRPPGERNRRDALSRHTAAHPCRGTTGRAYILARLERDGKRARHAQGRGTPEPSERSRVDPAKSRDPEVDAEISNIFG
jgi:hypothetical protein